MGYASLSNKMIEDIDTYEIYKHRLTFYDIDLNLPVPYGVAQSIGDVDIILHLAADSHVDRSIEDPVPFIKNNVMCTLNTLEYARNFPELKMFVNFSTDEVYGPAPIGHDFKEFEYHHPSNPYSASKSAQEAIGIAYSNTYKVPVVTTHTMNLIGQRQNVEKYVPKCIKDTLTGEKLYIHANKDRTKAGTRFYLHCRNLSDALLHIINLGYKGYDEWNIAGLQELSNLELALKIEGYVNEWQRDNKLPETKLDYELVDFHSSRPGHDLRYALDSSKLINSGYTYPKDLDESLRHTVRWTLDRREDYLL